MRLWLLAGYGLNAAAAHGMLVADMQHSAHLQMHAWSLVRGALLHRLWLR